LWLCVVAPYPHPNPTSNPNRNPNPNFNPNQFGLFQVLEELEADDYSYYATYERRRWRYDECSTYSESSHLLKQSDYKTGYMEPDVCGTCNEASRGTIACLSLGLAFLLIFYFVDDLGPQRFWFPGAGDTWQDADTLKYQLKRLSCVACLLLTIFFVLAGLSNFDKCEQVAKDYYDGTLLLKESYYTDDDYESLEMGPATILLIVAIVLLSLGAIRYSYDQHQFARLHLRKFKDYVMKKLEEPDVEEQEDGVPSAPLIKVNNYLQVPTGPAHGAKQPRGFAKPPTWEKKSAWLG